jgi:hypothetical protein
MVAAAGYEIAPGVTRVLEPAEVTELEAIIAGLARIDGSVGEQAFDADAVRVDQIDLLERVKAAAEAAQARVIAAFKSSQLQRQRAAGVRRDCLGRGIGDQVAMACRQPTSQGPRRLGFADAVVHEMPHTHALLSEGSISPWVATILVRETACLTREDRAGVDERMCATSLADGTAEILPAPVLGMTPRRVENAARKLAAELDVEAVVRRAARAKADRRVTVRPAPDTMSYLTGLLPVAQGVSVFAHLKAAAEAARAGGDPRTIAQLMADLLVERVTGQSSADAVPVEICVVMTPESLLGLSEEPAVLRDGTPLPARTARDLATNPDAPTWLRRLFTDPTTGIATAIDPRRRAFTRPQKQLIDARDRTCRLPGCQSPIAHHDHVRRHTDGGPTTTANGQGLCEGHNLAKEIPGWRSRVIDPRPGRHVIEVATPTGHRYRSSPPSALGP